MAAERGRSTSTLAIPAMQYQPIRAALLFVIGAFCPLVAVIAAYGRLTANLGVALFLAAVVSGVTFYLGAKLARRPHSTKSLIVCVLLTWVFSFSVNGLSSRIFPAGSLLGTLSDVLPLLFVFLLAWMRAPKQVASRMANKRLERAVGG